MFCFKLWCEGTELIVKPNLSLGVPNSWPVFSFIVEREVKLSTRTPMSGVELRGQFLIMGDTDFIPLSAFMC